MNLLHAAASRPLLLSAVIAAAAAACLPGLAHEAVTPVIVDTDVALDDVRALAVLAADDHAAVEAAVVTEGASSVEVGAANLRWALERLGLGAVPVAAGETTAGDAPAWREMSETLGYVLSDTPDAAEQGVPTPHQAMMDALSATEGDVVYLCLGPATTLAELVQSDPELASRLGAVYFVGDPPSPQADAWNTRRDPEALQTVLDAGLRVNFVWLDGEDWLHYDENLLEAISALDGAAAELIARMHRDHRVRAKIEAGHVKAWDETAVIAMLHPDRTRSDALGHGAGSTRIHHVDASFTREQLLAALGAPMDEPLPPRRSVVLDAYPVDPSMMRDDVAQIVPTLIERHGLEEWKATWLTNELHRHLGIYSIIGAKMGVRARELLGASVDEVSVTSEAGSDPPLACLNDGLQVSTGASLGRGTIRVLEEQTGVAAEFASGDRRVHLRLREEIIQRIRGDIRRARDEHGNLTPAYFDRVRELALEYWADLDRTEIFVEHFH